MNSELKKIKNKKSGADADDVVKSSLECFDTKMLYLCLDMIWTEVYEVLPMNEHAISTVSIQSTERNIFNK
jgi:hypothetical protein